MKPIYKSLALASMALSVSLSLQGQIYDGESTSESALSSELLDSMRVELVAPNVSGARDLIKSGECTVDGSDLSITLNTGGWVKGATYRIQVLATFGTQTQVIYALDVNVPYYETLESDPQKFEDEVVVVSTISNAGESTIVDAEITETSQHPVTSAAIYAGLAGKADAQETAQALAGKANGSVYAVEDQGDPVVSDVAAIHGSMLQFSSGATTKFEIDQSGNLVLYNNDTPVVLTPAKLAELIA